MSKKKKDVEPEPLCGFLTASSLTIAVSLLTTALVFTLIAATTKVLPMLYAMTSTTIFKVIITPWAVLATAIVAGALPACIGYLFILAGTNLLEQRKKGDK